MFILSLEFYQMLGNSKCKILSVSLTFRNISYHYFSSRSKQQSDFSDQLWIKSTFICDEYINRHLFIIIFSHRPSVN